MWQSGSLYDFVEPKIPPISNRPNPQIKNSAFPNPQRRIKTTLQNYSASPKEKLLRRNTTRTDEQLTKWDDQYEKYKNKKTFLHRDIRNFYSKINAKELKQKNRCQQSGYNHGHGLLRAIRRLNIQNEKHSKQKNPYDISLQNYSNKFKKLNIVPLMNLRKFEQNDEEEMINRRYRTLEPKRSKIKDKDRIQFQACLAWTKKHNKNSKYYLRKLGKANDVDQNFERLTKRKRILSVIKQKYEQKQISLSSIN